MVQLPVRAVSCCFSSSKGILEIYFPHAQLTPIDLPRDSADVTSVSLTNSTRISGAVSSHCCIFTSSAAQIC